MTHIHGEQPEREVSYDVKLKTALFTDDNKEIESQGTFKENVTENIGNLTSVTYSTDEVYNGYIKSNIINGTTYDTQYKETQEIMISKKDIQQKIAFTEDNYFSGNNDIVYKSTKIRQEDVKNLLGENGKIEILDVDENVLFTIDNTTEYNENGEIVLTYNEDVNKIIIRTSNIENVGTLYIENLKAIKSDNLNLDITQITTSFNLVGINEKENEEGEIVEEQVYHVENENIIEIKDSQTSVNLNLDNAEWTNRKQNEVTFDITLDSTSIRNNLFKNPTVRIQLPNQVEKVIINNTSVVYSNGLTLENAYIENDGNGNLSIVANLNGIQTGYSENDLGLMTDLKISAVVILKKDIESAQSKINLLYTNEFTTNATSEQGNIEKEVSIENYEEVQNEQNLTKNDSNILDEGNDLISTITEAAEKNVEESVRTATVEEIEGLKVEIDPVRGNTNLKDGDTIYEGEFIKYNVKITNTLDKDIEDIRVVGTIPDGTKYGELDSNFSFPDDYSYQYNFDEDLKEKEINIGTLKAGQTIEQSYEVQVKDLLDEEAQKEIITNIKVYIANTESYNYTLNNVVEQAEVKAFLWSKMDGPDDEWLYGVNLDIPEGKQATIKLTLPKIFSITEQNVSNGRVYLEAYKTQYSTNIDLKEDEEPITGASISYNGTEVTITASESGTYKLGLIIGDESIVKEQIKSGELEAKNGEVKLKANAVVIVDDKEYKTNENIIPYNVSELSVTMSSDNEGEEVRYGEKINYNISIKCISAPKNQENSNLEGIYVNVLDYLPENVNPVSVTYEYFDKEFQTVTGDEGEVQVPIGYSEKKVATEELYSSVTDTDGNKLPNVDIYINIPKGETVNITVKTTAGLVFERTEIENSAIVQAPNMDHITESETIDKIDTKISNVIKHIILPYNVDEGYEPSVPGEPTDPEDPENPTNPEEPSNPDDTVYSISGTSWNDVNGDGNRQDNEPLISRLQVMLVDMADSNNVKATTTINNGRYTFSNLKQGNYIVIFRYNTQNYLLTEYNANGVPESSNSDVTMQEITLNGVRVNVGVTDTISLTQDANNIDIGLVNKNGYDLKLDKYLTNVSVTTNSGTKYYSYDNTKLGRVEIRAKEINGAEVSVTYKIVVTNEGEAKVKVSEIYDYIPDGLTFSSKGNTNWTTDGKLLVNRSLMNQDLNPGESKEIVLTLTKTMNGEDTGTFTNAAEIGSVDTIEGVNDADSTPGNRKSNEDDYSEAQLIISISTGLGMYISIGVIVLIIAILTIVAIKLKFNIGKISKLGVSIMLFVLVGMFTCGNAFAVNFHYESRTQHRFSGGPTGTGYCSNHEWVAAGWHTDIEGDNAYCYHSESSYSNDYNNTTAINYGATNAISEGVQLSKRNDQIGVRKIGNNYVLGPFQITTNTTGQTITILDKSGNRIDGWGLCDANGNGNNPFGSTGNIDFYISLSSTLYDRGISSVSLTQTKSRSLHRHWTKTGSRHYTYIGGTCDAVNYYKNHQGVVTTDYVYEEGDDYWDENTSATVQWVNFNAGLDIIKQDADDSDVKLPNVEINVRCDDLGYNENFTTDENGSIHIDNLTPETYQVTEILNSNYGYEILESEEISLHSGMVRTYSLTNEKQTGNLKIEKKDTDNNKPLEGVSFRIRKNISAEDEEALADFVEGKGDINANGYIDENDLQILLRYVTRKQDLTEEQMYQADVNADGEVDILDMRLLLRKFSSTGYVVGMQNDESGNLTPLTTATGTVYLDNMQTTNNLEEATIFVTDKDGLIQIHNMLVGRYIVEEISVGDNYGYDIDDDYISWDNGNETGTGAVSTIEVTRQKSYTTVSDSNIIVDDQKVIEDGTYEIQSNVGTNKVIEIYRGYAYNGSNVTLYDRNKTISQKFYIRYLGEGYYSIISLYANKYVEVAGASTSPGANVQIYQGNGTDAQKWKIQDEGNGNYSLVSKCNGLYMDVYGAGTANDTNIQVYTDNGSAAQRYRLNDLADVSGVTESGFSTVTYNNRRKYIKLSGYVWEDMISSKTSVRDYLYTAPDTDERNGDKLVANVTVKLKDGNGNTISFKTESGEEVNEIKTDVNGAYTMVDILIDELDNYYIEFTYNGMSYTPVPILDILNENGSKALEGEERDIFNEEYAQIADDDNNEQNVGKSNNSNGEQTHNINYNYNTDTQKSSVNYGERAEYGYDGQLFPINETDEQYLITATTYNGYTSVGGSGYLSDIKTAEDIRKQGTTEIENINMGLYQREQPDLSVVKDIERANVTVAGAEHIYVYADRLNEDLWEENGVFANEFADEGVTEAHELEPQVKFQEEGLYGSMSYTRYLYASDIMYKDGENADDKLSVKMTYVISIKNQATTLKTQIYELEDYYDTKYANIVGIGTQMNADGSIVSGTEVNYTTTNENVDKYTKIIIGGGNEAILNIDPQSKGNIYVQLEVNRDNIVDIVEGMADEVKLDNVAEVARYGTTSVNENQEEITYAGIDKDSQPGNTDVNDRTTWEDDTDLAPGMVLKLQEARQVNGNVFLDTDENSLDEGKRTHAGEERQGNGIYDDDEVGIKNVKVTLKDSSGNTAQFYNEETGNFEEAVTYTNENGEYSFEGFIPGDYYITYTWGGNVVNGENSTYNQNGTEETVNVQNYKSTIVNETVWNDKGTNNQWYKDSFKQNYDGVEWNSANGTEIRNSDAVDDWNIRQEIDGEVGDMTYGEKEKLENSYNGNPEGGETYSNTQMESNTQGFSVELEYTDTADNNITNQRDEFQQNADGSLAEDGNGDYITNGYFVNRLNSIDFGIIERARQILELDKSISRVRITLANGNVVVNAKLVDGVLQDITQNVTVVPPSAANNGQVKVEIDQELVQGAELDIDYGLKVTNASELDYQTQEFYMFGKGHGENADELVTLQPSLIVDYIDANITTSEEWKVLSTEEKTNYIYDINNVNSEGLLSPSLKDTLKDSTIKAAQTEQLKDNILKPIGEESERSVVATLQGRKLLSINDETFLENHAEIIKVKRNNGGSVLITTPGNYVPSDLSTSEEDNSVSESVTVLPPTGLETDYIAYTLLTLSSLGILVSGIILIKKYVLRRD